MSYRNIRIHPPEEDSSIILELLSSDSRVKAEIGNISESQLGLILQRVTSSDFTPEDIFSEIKQDREIKVSKE